MRINISDILEKDLNKKVIIFQTDTVYGIGTPINNVDGIKRIYNLKKRESNNPLAILCANIEQVKKITKNFDDGIKLMEKYWPGALTIIFDKTDIVSDKITSGYQTVGVRIPNDKKALKILNKTGPLAVTSLNISKEPPILKFNDTLSFLNDVDYIVNGPNLYGKSSTVYDLKNKKILRQGSVKI